MRDIYGRDDVPARKRSGDSGDATSSSLPSSIAGPTRADRRRHRAGSRTKPGLLDTPLRNAVISRRSSRTLKSQIEELAAIEGVSTPSSPPPSPASAPLDLLPHVIDPMLGQGSGTVSTAICEAGTTLEPIPAGILSGAASHEPELTPGRKVRNPHKPHVIRLPEQVRRSAGHVPAKLRPVRDTGVSCMSRADRVRARQTQRLRFFGVLAALLVVGFIAAGVYWKAYSDEQASQIDLTASASLSIVGAAGASGSVGATGTNAVQAADSAVASTMKLVSLEPSDTPTGAGAQAAVIEVTKSGVTPATPTPIMATFRKINVYLPVSVSRLTEVGFHQANYSYAMQMDTHMPSMSVTEAKGKQGTDRDKSLQKYGKDSRLVGSYIELWRSGRSAKPRTAADCGAKPGTLVVAPVTGTVSKVATYKLEGKATDYEVHIVPDGAPDLEVVVIHISDVVVREGDHVRGGATPIARVRDISKIVRSQLASYANYEGNHTHIQINDTDCAAYLAKHKDD